LPQINIPGRVRQPYYCSRTANAANRPDPRGKLRASTGSTFPIRPPPDLQASAVPVIAARMSGKRSGSRTPDATWPIGPHVLAAIAGGGNQPMRVTILEARSRLPSAQAGGDRNLR